MIKIKSLKTEKFYLPQYANLPEEEQGWVMLETPLRMNSFSGLGTGMNPMDQQNTVIASKIKDWNYADEEGKKLEISAETVGIIPIADYGAISEKLEFAKLAASMSPLKKKPSTNI